MSTPTVSPKAVRPRGPRHHGVGVGRHAGRDDVAGRQVAAARGERGGHRARWRGSGCDRRRRGAPAGGREKRQDCVAGDAPSRRRERSRQPHDPTTAARFPPARPWRRRASFSIHAQYRLRMPPKPALRPRRRSDIFSDILLADAGRQLFQSWNAIGSNTDGRSPAKVAASAARGGLVSRPRSVFVQDAARPRDARMLGRGKRHAGRSGVAPSDTAGWGAAYSANRLLPRLCAVIAPPRLCVGLLAASELPSYISRDISQTDPIWWGA